VTEISHRQPIYSRQEPSFFLTRTISEDHDACCGLILKEFVYLSGFSGCPAHVEGQNNLNFAVGGAIRGP